MSERVLDERAGGGGVWHLFLLLQPPRMGQSQTWLSNIWQRRTQRRHTKWRRGHRGDVHTRSTPHTHRVQWNGIKPPAATTNGWPRCQSRARKNRPRPGNRVQKTKACQGKVQPSLDVRSANHGPRARGVQFEHRQASYHRPQRGGTGPQDNHTGPADRGPATRPRPIPAHQP